MVCNGLRAGVWTSRAFGGRGVVAVAACALLVGCGSSGQVSVPPVAGSSGAPPVGPAQPSAPQNSAGAGAGSVAPAPVESNVPGDIPDNVAYVPYTNPVGHFSLRHPEGWVSAGSGSSVTFTDKLNGIHAQAVGGATPTLASARSQDVPALMRSQPAFELRDVKAVTLPAGPGVLIVYRRNSAADPVTGRVFRDEVQRYEVARGGHGVDLELYGAVGSDNVDPYRMISQSLRFG
jgi:hypothetical protein